MKKLIFFLISFAFAINVSAQTAASLFWRSDSLQTSELFSKGKGMYSKIGHHGPAVENSMMGLRIYYNDSGAIDVYSKSGAQMELLKYLWYPSALQMEKEGAGCDEYYVGKSLGLGGVNLWDDGKFIALSAKEGRRARVGQTQSGHFAEIVYYGVPYRSQQVDISLRIDVENGSRLAKVTARCLSEADVQFVTGVNYNPQAECKTGKGYISIWGVHPANVSTQPIPIGGGMRYDTSIFPNASKNENMYYVVSTPTRSASTVIVSASVKEKELNSFRKFSKFVSRIVLFE